MKDIHVPFPGELNKEQNEAVVHSEGPLLILAGAGSGKTRTLTHRIAYLLDKCNVSPYRIIAVTFTNKAANEMKFRVSSLIRSSIKGLWLGTFHSICLRILKRDIEHLEGFKSDFIIFDVQDQLKLIRDCVKLLEYNERMYEPRAIRSKIDSYKMRVGDVNELGSEFKDDKLKEIFDLYESELRKNNALDFNDLLFLTVRLFSEHPKVLEFYQDRFEYILVDEYQDTNNLQYSIVRSLAQKNGNIFVVGDDNQSIYSWRGADIQNILNFESDFSNTRTIKLEKNYRSTGNILRLSNELIKNNLERKEKTLYTDNPEGELIGYYQSDNEEDEARNLIKIIQEKKREQGISFNDFAVFYRTNNQSKAIEDELIKSDILYNIIGGVGFYQRAEVKDIVSYLRLTKNSSDNLSLKRIINVPPRGLGKVTLTNLELLSQEHGLSLSDAIQYAIDHKVFSPLTTTRLENFYQLIQSLKKASTDLSVAELIKKIIKDTSYIDLMEGEEEKVNNLSSLVNLAEEFDTEEQTEATLENFLDWIMLASESGNRDDSKEKISLMTLHSAKGLEFPFVFITGLEEGLLPHFKSEGDIKAIEEERRLFYVGITRAKEKVYLSGASARKNFGKSIGSIPSRFVGELPKDLVDWKRYEEVSYQKRVNRTKDENQTDQTERVINSSDPSIKKGREVRHNTFGKGVVLGVEGNGDKAKVTVFFKSVGNKKVLASYLIH